MESGGYLEEMIRLAAAGELQGIWFWAAVYTSAVCTYSLWFQLRTRYWPSADGELTSLGVRRFGGGEWAKSDREYAGTANYTYDVDGVRYEGSRISPWAMVVSYNVRALLRYQLSGVQKLPNGRVRVYHHPRNPGKSYLIVAGWVGISVTLMVAVLPGATYFFRFHGG